MAPAREGKAQAVTRLMAKMKAKSGWYIATTDKSVASKGSHTYSKRSISQIPSNQQGGDEVLESFYVVSIDANMEKNKAKVTTKFDVMCDDCNCHY